MVVEWLFLLVVVSTLSVLVCGKPEGFVNRSALSFFNENNTLDKILNAEEMYMTVANANSNKSESRPSWSYPFILFHQRKAGGSSLRGTISQAAVRNQYDPFIPCNGVHCDIIHIPYHKPHGVYAGHFAWGQQFIFDRFGGSHSRDHFSCLTNFREPISRMISCVHYRFVPLIAEYGCLSNMTSNQLLDVLITKTDKYGTSCLNEPFRMMSGISDENVLNELGIEWKVNGSSDSKTYELHTKFTHLEEYALRRTLHNVAKCGVLILEQSQNDTNLVLQRRFPDLYRAGAFRPIVLNSQHAFDKCPALTFTHIEMLETLGAFERVLYDIVVKQQRQLVRTISAA